MTETSRSRCSGNAERESHTRELTKGTCVNEFSAVTSSTLTSSQIFFGIALTVGLAVTCQVIASRLRIPAIILLLPVGFAAGALTRSVNPNNLLGPAFSPLVGIAVAIVLFDGGLDLVRKEMGHEDRNVVRRLRGLGIPITWAGAGVLAWLLLGLSAQAGIMRARF